MRRKILKVKNMVAAVVATAILILAVVGYVTDTFGSIKESLFGEPASYNGAYVEMLDVGQGDCILLVSGDKTALIDTGTKSSFKAIKKQLKNKNIDTIDLLLITHNHSDHAGCVDLITDKYPVKTLMIPDLNKTDENTDKMRAAVSNVERSGGKCVTAGKGTKAEVGEFRINVIAAYYDEKDENDRSIIAMVKLGKWKFLFTGDAQDAAEKRLMEDGADIKCDVLKVGHHGSMYGTSEEFIEATSPSFAMISCGKGNRYSHPHDVLLLRLNEAGVKFWRTDTNGNVTFNISEKEITVSTDK